MRWQHFQQQQLHRPIRYHDSDESLYLHRMPLQYRYLSDTLRFHDQYISHSGVLQTASNPGTGLQESHAIGDCTTDQMSITSPGKVGSPIICGTNTDQHSKNTSEKYFHNLFYQTSFQWLLTQLDLIANALTSILERVQRLLDLGIFMWPNTLVDKKTKLDRQDAYNISLELQDLSKSKLIENLIFLIDPESGLMLSFSYGYPPN